MRRHVFWGGLIIAAVVFPALPASAACVNTANIFCDSTVIQAYGGAAPTNWGGAGFVRGVGDVVQGAGNPFDTDRLDVKVTSSAGTTSLKLKYYTSFNGNAVTARYADIFSGQQSGLSRQPPLRHCPGRPVGQWRRGLAGFYSLASASDTETSIQLWSGKGGYIYGGQYLGLDGSWHDGPTAISALAALQNNWTVNVVEGASGDALFPYLVDVTLMASTQDFATLFGDGMSIFWGTGDWQQ